MRAALSARERDHLAFGELLPAGGRAEGGPAFEDDEQLFALHVVVEDHLVAGLELVDAGAEVLRPGPLTDASGLQTVS